MHEGARKSARSHSTPLHCGKEVRRELLERHAFGRPVLPWLEAFAPGLPAGAEVIEPLAVGFVRGQVSGLAGVVFEVVEVLARVLILDVRCLETHGQTEGLLFRATFEKPERLVAHDGRKVPRLAVDFLEVLALS